MKEYNIAVIASLFEYFCTLKCISSPKNLRQHSGQHRYVSGVLLASYSTSVLCIQLLCKIVDFLTLLPMLLDLASRLQEHFSSQ